MTILGIGIDILSLARLQGLIDRRGASALARRICSAKELSEFEGLSGNQHLKYLSVRWCLKEAAYKSLSSHIRPRWSGFDVLTSPHTPPTIRMTDRIVFRRGAEVKKEEVGLMASLSNDAGVVVGVVIAMKKG